MKRLLIILPFLFCIGCATLIHGTTQKIQVTSEPDSARVKVSTGGEYTTPVSIELSRKTDHVLVFSKGTFATQEVTVYHVISGAIAASFLTGGLIGSGFDAASGAAWKLVPENVHVILVPAK